MTEQQPGFLLFNPGKILLVQKRLDIRNVTAVALFSRTCV